MSKPNEEEFWTYYQLYQRPTYSLPEVKERQESVVRLLKRKRCQGGSLLEIGFGSGYLLELCHKDFQCTGLDISQANVELTRNEFYEKGLKDVSFVAADIHTYIPEKAFDVAVACHVLEHFNDDELSDVFAKIYNILTEDGLFFGAVPYKQNLALSKVFCPRCGHIFDKDEHKQSFDELSLCKKLTESGFTVQVLNTHVRGNQYYQQSLVRRLLRRVYWVTIGFKPTNGLEFVALKKTIGHK